MIEQLDIAALPDGELDQVYEVWLERYREWRPDDPAPDRDAWRAMTLSQPAHRTVRRHRARTAAGDLAGYVEVRWNEVPENRNVAEVWLAVRRRHRRQGVGRALLARAAEEADSDRRAVLTGATHDALPAGGEFARALGGREVLVTHENRLDLAQLDRALLRDWVAAGERSAPEYGLVLVDGATPLELRAKVAAAVQLMNGAPTGDATWEDERVTADEVAAWDDAIARSGRRSWAYFVEHRAGGEFVGFTNVFWHPGTAALLQQGGTAVDSAHRGRGLGKWLKAAMLEKVLAEVPEARAVVTENAYVNDPMLSINHRLGFRPHGTERWWEVETARVLRYTSGQSARPLE